MAVTGAPAGQAALGWARASGGASERTTTQAHTLREPGSPPAPPLAAGGRGGGTGTGQGGRCRARHLRVDGAEAGREVGTGRRGRGGAGWAVWLAGRPGPGQREALRDVMGKWAGAWGCGRLTDGGTAKHGGMVSQPSRGRKLQGLQGEAPGV